MSTSLSYDFLTPPRIVFGWGRRREVGKLGRSLGRRAFLVCGLPTAVAEPILAELSSALEDEGVAAVFLATLLHEPEVEDVDRISAELRRRGIQPGDFLLGLGGGAAIDLAKAAAAMATNSESATVKDYLEGVGRGLTLQNSPLPVMAMPTTAATGAEATKNAVISCYDPPFKKSLRDDRLLPRVALLDPELSVSVPASVTAAGGMDAMTQCIESYVSRKAQPIPRALALQGLALGVPALPEAVANGRSRPAREAMAHAALLSGMALANSGLGMAHGVAAALGTLCRVPHGTACAVMLPAAIRANLETSATGFAALERALCDACPAAPRDATAAFLQRIETLCDRVGVPRRLGPLGVRREQIPAIVEASRGSSMSGNPREIPDDELTAILEGLL